MSKKRPAVLLITHHSSLITHHRFSYARPSPPNIRAGRGAGRGGRGRARGGAARRAARGAVGLAGGVPRLQGALRARGRRAALGAVRGRGRDTPRRGEALGGGRGGARARRGAARLLRHRAVGRAREVWTPQALLVGRAHVPPRPRVGRGRGAP